MQNNLSNNTFTQITRTISIVFQNQEGNYSLKKERRNSPKKGVVSNLLAKDLISE